MATVDEGREAAPERRDRMVAARTAGLMTIVATLWFFVSPFAYWGASNTSSAWNAWLVGALMFLLACARELRPLRTRILSKINAVLAVWVFISPWVYGYTGYTGRFVNSLCVGLFVFAMSIASLKNPESSNTFGEF